jgi:hypothetical protein
MQSVIDDERGNGSMLSSVCQLHPTAGVERMASAIEDRIAVVLLRLMVEDENDFSGGVQACIVVVTILRRGDAVAGECDGRRELNVAVESTGEIGGFVKVFGSSSVDQSKPADGGVGAVCDQWKFLKVGAIGGRLEAAAFELRGNVLRGYIGLGRQRNAAGEGLGGEEFEVSMEASGLGSLRPLASP